jgi:hypothetical protein
MSNTAAAARSTRQAALMAKAEGEETVVAALFMADRSSV